MTQAINIYTLSRIHEREAFNILERHTSRYREPKRTQDHEIESLRLLADELMKHEVSVAEMDGFFYSFHIPHIGKEFDLLKLSGRICLNIELKSTAVPEEQIAELYASRAREKLAVTLENVLHHQGVALLEVGEPHVLVLANFEGVNLLSGCF